MTGRWVTQRPDAGRLCPVALTNSAVLSQHVIGLWQGPVMHDRTSSVGKIRLWNLTGNDRTLEAECPVSCSGASGQEMTVEIRRTVFEAEDAWRASRDRTLRASVRSIRTGASGHPALYQVKGYNGSIS